MFGSFDVKWAREIAASPSNTRHSQTPVVWIGNPENVDSKRPATRQFQTCEVDAVHLGFRLSCFTPFAPLILKGGLYRHVDYDVCCENSAYPFCVSGNFECLGF